jgi:Flp pilus assembly protein TadG
MRINRQQRRREAGNAMLEGALVMSAFLMIMFGIIDFSRAVFAYNSVEYASREGARWASVRGVQSGQEASAGDVQAFVMKQLVGLTASDTTVNVNWASGKTPGAFVTVTVNHNFQPIAPYIPTGTWQLQGLSRMVISQ